MKQRQYNAFEIEFKSHTLDKEEFLNMDETTDECAVRELEEETGLKDVFVEQLQAFSDVDRDPRGRTITVAYYALVNPVGMNVAGYDDAFSGF